MPLRTKVKVGNITNLSDARYCAGMGVDLLGFPVGPGGLDPARYKEIIDWVSGPEFILETHHLDHLDPASITDHYPGHYIQISQSQIDWLTLSLQFILSLKASEWSEVAPRIAGRSNIKFIELTTDAPLDVLRAINREIPVLVHPRDLPIDQVLSMPISGIALDATVEERPGLKDYGNVASVLESLEID